MPATYENIATYLTPNGSATSYTFSGIPQTFTDLRLVLNGSFTNGNDSYKVTMNGQTSYSISFIYFSGSAPAAAESTTYSQALHAPSATSGGASEYPHFVMMNIWNYTANIRQGFDFRYCIGYGNPNGVPAFTFGGGGLNNTQNGITSITIGSVNNQGLAQNSIFTLYGIKAA